MDDVTSLTKEEENKRQQIAKEKIRQSRKRQAESEIHTETDQLRGSLPKASRKESVLDASIHQVFSGETLNGDTINFYFHYLRENYACLEVKTVGLGSTYFYPSLERGDDVYRKYIDKTSLWETRTL